MSAESRKHFVLNNFVHGLKLFIADFCSSIDLALSFELICKNNQTVIINFLGEENPDEIHASRSPLPPPPPFPRDSDLGFPVATSSASKTEFRHSHDDGGNGNHGQGNRNDDGGLRNGIGREDPRRPNGAPAGLGAPPPPLTMDVHSPIGVPAPQGVPPPPMSAHLPTKSASATTTTSTTQEQTVFGQSIKFTAKEKEDTPEENRGMAEPENWRKRVAAAKTNNNNSNNHNNNHQSKNKNEVRPPPAVVGLPVNRSKADEKKRRGGGGGIDASSTEDRRENLDSTVNYLFDELELEDTPRKRKQTAATAMTNAPAETSLGGGGSSSKADAANEAETPSPPDAKRRVRFEKKDGFICSKCGQFFNRFRNYYLHQVKRHDKKKKDEILEGIKDKKFKCPDCLFSSDCKREIDKHRKKYHPDLYKCSECSFTTYTRTKLNEHSQIYH